MVVVGAGPGVVVLEEVDELVPLVVPDGPPVSADVRAAVEVGEAVEVAVAVGSMRPVGSVADELELTAGSVPRGSALAPIAASDDAACAWPDGRWPPNTDHRPHPTSRRTIATIPKAPMTDIERIPTAPPAPGGRWRPDPCSVVNASQDMARPAAGPWRRRKSAGARGSGVVQEGSARRRSSASAEGAWWVPWGSNPQPTD